MRVATTGLSESQQLEALMLASGVGEHRARAMLARRPWDAVVVNGNVLVEERSLRDVVGERRRHSAAVSVLIGVSAHTSYGEAHSLGGSDRTILVTPVGGELELVRS